MILRTAPSAVSEVTLFRFASDGLSGELARICIHARALSSCPTPRSHSSKRTRELVIGASGQQNVYGAGKTTTMRLILGLDCAIAGTVTVNGKRYPQLPVPMREIGALLDARAVHGGRSARNHLLCLAQTK
jgi:ABC-type uncharacterized transport system ATPase subunit